MTLPFSPVKPEPLEYFRLLVADDAQFNLLEAAVLVAQDEHPDLDAASVLTRVDGLARRLQQRLPADAAGAQRLRLLRQFFFGELGFAVNVNDYYAVENSHLHRVLDTRRGIPITLSILLIEIGTQIGLKMAGVSFPGHFLVKCRLNQGEVIIDPLDGRSLSREELAQRLQPYLQRQGLPVEFDIPLSLFLQTAPPRDILARVLRNLKEIHRAQEDWERLRRVMDRLILVVPQEWAEHRDRGLVMAELEQWAAAADALALYLDHQPQADDAAALGERLVELRRLASLH